MHVFHMHKLKKNCIPINHKLWSDRLFPVQSDGEHPRWQFEREDGQKDSEKRVCDVPPHTFWSFSAICVTMLLFAFWPRTFTIELNEKKQTTLLKTHNGGTYNKERTDYAMDTN